jgi:AcrR family transcriptional regulator
MGVAERRERDKRRRYNEILDAAEKVFFKKGLRNSTMDEVAEAAELSKGTIYLYFKSKELLYMGINLRALEILRNRFSEAVRQAENGIGKVQEIGKAYIQYANEYPDYFNAMAYYESMDSRLLGGIFDDPLTERCHDVGMSVLQILADCLREGMSDGSIRSDIEPMRTAILLWAQSNGLILLLKSKADHFREEHKLDGSQLLNDFREFTRSALAPQNNAT